MSLPFGPQSLPHRHSLTDHSPQSPEVPCTTFMLTVTGSEEGSAETKRTTARTHALPTHDAPTRTISVALSHGASCCQAPVLVRTVF